MINKKVYPAAIGLCIVLMALWVQLSDITLVHQGVQRLDSLVYDLRLKSTLRRGEQDRRVVIVDIDEKSLGTEGHWPWSRDKLGQLVDNLFTQGAAVVGFDIVFAEAERNSGQTVLQRLQESGQGDAHLTAALRQNLPLFDNNAAFADRLKERDVVLGYIFHTQGGEPLGALPQPLVVQPAETVSRIFLEDARSYTGNIATLQQAAQFGGFFSLEPDPDGIIRRAPIIVRYKDAIYPSLALETARRFLLVDEVALQTAIVGNNEVIESVHLGQVVIPTDSEGRVVIPYRGTWGSFPYISATDVLRNTVPDGALEGAIVLIGTTAQGLFDLRAVPIQAVYPGVEVHANIIAAILDGRFPMEPAWATGADFLLSLIIGVTLALLFPFLSPLALVLLSLAVLAAEITFNFWLFLQQGLILSLAIQVLLVALLAGFNMAYGFLTEFRSKRVLQGMFGQYVPPELVAEMSENPEQYGFEGESREMTVLFADIRGFTTLSEKLSANQLKAVLNRFFTPMTRIIFERRGTIDKYVGDMVMAFWGAPVEDPDHAIHAIEAGLAMLVEVERLKPEFKQSGFPTVEIGIGLNSGIMNVGDMGSEYRRAYTVLGDTVNLGSRLEGTTRFYQVGMVVGEETQRLAAEHFVFRELDLIRVKGKAQAIHVYEPVCSQAQATNALQQELELYRQGLEHYRAQQWEQAHRVFAELKQQHEGVWLYQLYLQRIEELQANPPGSDWDGVYTRTEK